MSQTVSKFFERRKIKEYISERSWNISVIYTKRRGAAQAAVAVGWHFRVMNRWATRDITIGRMFSSGFASHGKKRVTSVHVIGFTDDITQRCLMRYDA